MTLKKVGIMHQPFAPPPPSPHKHTLMDRECLSQLTDRVCDMCNSKHTRIENNKQIIVSGNCVQRNMQGYQLDQ